MVIELTGEQEAMVLRLAEESGMTASQVVADTLARFLEFDPEERKIIEERLDEADRGAVEWISHEEIGRRMGLR